jgi:hypothetical protein
MARAAKPVVQDIRDAEASDLSQEGVATVATVAAPQADNMDLWHRVEKTDPRHVKPITGKTYSGNSPKPHYLIHKATETFGPCGIGWGFDIKAQEIVRNGDNSEALSCVTVEVWYRWNGEIGHVTHVGATPLWGKRSSGKLFMDEDSFKKSTTDALTKALSLIGFAGDIFMGRWDDSKYVQELTREIREEEKQAAAVEQYKEQLRATRAVVTNTHEDRNLREGAAAGLTTDQLSYLALFQTACESAESIADLEILWGQEHANRVKMGMREGEGHKRLTAIAAARKAVILDAERDHAAE